jgi:hypothetical protein
MLEETQNENKSEETQKTFELIIENHDKNKPNRDNILKLVYTLNVLIGFYKWKHLFYAAFYDNISVPINLCLLIFTSLTTGQSATQDLIDQQTSVRLGVASVFITICNTFFRPAQKYHESVEMLKKWNELGTKFEELTILENLFENDKESVLFELLIEVNKLRRTCKNNFFLDFLFFIGRKFKGKKLYWNKHINQYQ